MNTLRKCLYIAFVLMIFIYNSFAQDSLTTEKFVSISKDSLTLFQIDTLKLNLSYPLERELPKDILRIPIPKSQFDIDMRSGSYYTPRNVQDKMDHIMNRPRQDSFVPILGLAAFAVSVAAKQLEASKLFDPNAEDYLLPEQELLVLEELWKKSPQEIDDLYSRTLLNENNTARELQKTITKLTDKNLVKTRTDGIKVVLFFPAQKLEYVQTIIKMASHENYRSEQEIAQLNSLLKRLTEVGNGLNIEYQNAE